jgi:hypothetical protein
MLVYAICDRGRCFEGNSLRSTFEITQRSYSVSHTYSSSRAHKDNTQKVELYYEFQLI